ncbi:glucarate dehydratase family protein [Okibacterium endophyticum]
MNGSQAYTHDYRIADLSVVPLAFSDPPLLNAAGVHEPLALRTIVRIELANGVHAIGEGRGDALPTSVVDAVRETVVGQNVFQTTRIEHAVDKVLRRLLPGCTAQDRLISFAPIEVACLDAQGKTLGLPVSTLLGGAVRDQVDYSAYLFYKWAGHLGAEPDEWGEALDPDGVVRQARCLIDRYGFRSIKLKAGVLAPEIEADTILALAQAFPGMPLRIDPNGAWRHDTAVAIGRRLGSVLEYLEDPVLGIEGMSRVHNEIGIPLATNMCVVEMSHLRSASERRAVQIVLSDHHYWGGLRRTKDLGAICEALGISISMHSNSHLGVSLAAMTHVAATMENLAYACDTHWPWNRADDIVPTGGIEIIGGAVRVPTTPGLGVEIDEGRLGELHERYLSSGRTIRDDAGYMRRVDPSFDPSLPRF